ncbi:MAG: prepilin-type N-terminal cleavage/methylation domain-containing protein [Nitrospira sp.]|nr:prepilin-type N-terminal cleavage/methylation domain-containing protein [Nitrospira sp.]MBH0189572.1 prepilin-type N-terminal cleavage/methylation domain-containing protein [Nitrospira sp.]MBH0194774.1 prepilin-type N-terminal cleavage/methylation domain-containing protein [Nitrospira sp.]
MKSQIQKTLSVDMRRPVQRTTADASGFTLLEVLLAIALLAIALPVLLGLRNFDLDLHARAGDLTAATLLAQEKLIETELAGVYPIGEAAGDFSNMPLGAQPPAKPADRGTGYRWKRTIAPTPLELIREVRIQVSWPRGAFIETVEVSTYVISGLNS